MTKTSKTARRRASKSRSRQEKTSEEAECKSGTGNHRRDLQRGAKGNLEAENDPQPEPRYRGGGAQGAPKAPASQPRLLEGPRGQRPHLNPVPRGLLSLTVGRGGPLQGLPTCLPRREAAAGPAGPPKREMGKTQDVAGRCAMEPRIRLQSGVLLRGAWAAPQDPKRRPPTPTRLRASRSASSARRRCKPEEGRGLHQAATRTSCPT